MANELRVRANLLPTLVLTSAYDPSTDTTIAAAELANWPVIDTTNHMAVTVDWDRGTGTPFILYITAHSSAATTATVAKDMEDTTATAVPIGTECIHGPTMRDYILSVDSPHGGDLGYDVVFNRQGETTPPTGWAWVNQGTSTMLEQDGALVITPQGGDAFRMIRRAVPAEASFVLDAKIIADMRSTNYARGGVLLSETSSGKILHLAVASEGNIQLNYFTDPTTFSSSLATIIMRFVPRYFRIRKNSSTSWDFEVSSDGRAWVSILAAYNVSALFTPAEVGVGISITTALYGSLAAEWLRVR